MGNYQLATSKIWDEKVPSKCWDQGQEDLIKQEQRLLAKKRELERTLHIKKLYSEIQALEDK